MVVLIDPEASHADALIAQPSIVDGAAPAVLDRATMRHLSRHHLRSIRRDYGFAPYFPKRRRALLPHPALLALAQHQVLASVSSGAFAAPLHVPAPVERDGAAASAGSRTTTTTVASHPGVYHTVVPLTYLCTRLESVPDLATGGSAAMLATMGAYPPLVPLAPGVPPVLASVLLACGRVSPPCGGAAGGAGGGMGSRQSSGGSGAAIGAVAPTGGGKVVPPLPPPFPATAPPQFMAIPAAPAPPPVTAFSRRDSSVGFRILGAPPSPRVQTVAATYKLLVPSERNVAVLHDIALMLCEYYQLTKTTAQAAEQ